MRHPDQQVIEQRGNFLGVAAQPFDIARQFVELRDLHPANHPAYKRLALVATEIMTELLFEDPRDHEFGLVDLFGLVLQPVVFGQAVLGQTAPGELNQAERHLLDRQDDVHQPSGNRLCRHTGLGRLLAIRTLSNGEPAGFLDGLDADRAVATAVRQHDPDRLLAPVLGQRMQERIDQIGDSSRAATVLAAPP
jgi:hypothetical protein